MNLMRTEYRVKQIIVTNDELLTLAVALTVWTDQARPKKNGHPNDKVAMLVIGSCPSA